ncbi:hypothetical protein EBR43_08645 [bacterium]|nr:hypothetical protein [bacterium]
MRIDGLIENTFRNSRLKRVRVKVDPSQLVTQGYENVSSFEGYVLEECATTVQVYLLNVPKEFDNVQTVDKKFVTPVEAPTLNPSFCNLKAKILKHLEGDGISQDSPLYKQIQSCDSPDFIDSYLKSGGYEGDKLTQLYKKALLQEASLVDLGKKLKNINLTDVAAKTARGLKGVTDSPLFKIADVATKAIAKAPGLIVGKNNIIGRVAKFMQTLDVNDLINVDKYKLKIGDTTEPEVGDSIYIKGLDLPIDTKKLGNIEYQIRGILGEPSLRRKKRSNVIHDIFPINLRRQLALDLDYATLGNPEHTGILTVDFLDTKYPSRYYEVKVDDFKNNLFINVIKRLDEREGSISWRLMQDETVLVVSRALNQFLNGRKLDNYELTLNTITHNILMNKDKKLEIFDEAMVELIQDKNAMASSNPDMYLKKYLGPIGLYK